MSTLPYQTPKKNKSGSKLRSLQKKSLCPKNPWDVMGCQVATCFEAPEVSLGGSGVSIGGVRSLRILYMGKKKQNNEKKKMWGGGSSGEFKPASSALEPVLQTARANHNMWSFRRLKSDSKRRDLSISS